MKKKILLAAIAVSTMSFAQDISFGAKAGVNLANVSQSGSLYKDAKDPKMITSFHIGGFAELKLTDMISLQPELLFSVQGSKNEFLDDNDFIKNEGKSTTKYNYLNIPVMGKFYVAEGLSLEVGPQIGFLMSAKSKSTISNTIKATDKEESKSVEQNLKDFESVSNIDFGINTGLAYKLDSGLFFGARYNFGFSNINSGKFKDLESGKVSQMTDAQLKEYVSKNSVIQISIGYFFK